MADEQINNRICVCSMLKNESKVVERMLNGCFESLNFKCPDQTKPFELSAVCITDTGSTDGTQEIIRKWCSDRKIPFRIVSENWTNFGVNRTQSLVNSKLFFPDVDYYLLVDGDMELKVGDVSKLNQKLTENSYILLQKNSGSCYYNTRLISSKAIYRCVGSTHEYWGDVYHPGKQKFEGFYFDDHNDGGSKSDKYERDLRLLLRGMRENITPDFVRSRYTYYLGQSYQGKNEHDKSDYWLQQKIKTGGWDEEVFYSMYQTAENMYKRGGKHIEKSIVLYLKAWNYRPRRAEPLYGAARAARECGMKEVAKNFIKIGIEIPKPEDILFLNEGVYNGKLFNEELSKL